VAKCASVVGPAPLGDGGLDRQRWFDGMVEGNVREFGWALAGEDTLQEELERITPAILASVDSDSKNVLGDDYALSEADAEVASRPDIRSMFAISTREAIGPRLDGMVDDDLAFVEPWGFEPSAITLPTAVWYGPHDRLVPTGHGEWLGDHIPGAEVVVLDGGHFAIYDRLSDLLAWLSDIRPEPY
jgi:pimeloyl-ACP methyl ester carboxylesterase